MMKPVAQTPAETVNKEVDSTFTPASLSSVQMPYLAETQPDNLNQPTTDLPAAPSSSTQPDNLNQPTTDLPAVPSSSTTTHTIANPTVSLDFQPIKAYDKSSKTKHVTFQMDLTDGDGNYDEDMSTARTHATFPLTYDDHDGVYEVDHSPLLELRDAQADLLVQHISPVTVDGCDSEGMPPGIAGTASRRDAAGGNHDLRPRCRRVMATPYIASFIALAGGLLSSCISGDLDTDAVPFPSGRSSSEQLRGGRGLWWTCKICGKRWPRLENEVLRD